MREPTALELAAFRAEVDQHHAAVREVAWRWPDNAHLIREPYPDGRIVRAMFQWWINPPDEGRALMRLGTIYIVWLANGSFTSCPPGHDVEFIARAHAPWRVLECDLCAAHGDADERLFAQSFLLVPMRAWLIAFALCGACSYASGADARTRLVRPPRKESNG